MKPFPAKSIVDWLDASESKFPDSIAIEDSAGRCISYRELAAASRAVQTQLVAAGVEPGDRVGVFMKKSIDTLIAFQGILRAGGTYVPLDSSTPASRAALMLNDSEAGVIFVDEDLQTDLRLELESVKHTAQLFAIPAKTDKCHAGLESAIPGNRLAFLLYTSGSTGKPKGVTVTHENVIDFIDWCSEAFVPTERDKFAVVSPLHFSLPVFQLYLAWKHGGTVVLMDDQTSKAPELLARGVERHRVTIWFSTPANLILLAQSGLLPSLNLDSLRLIMFAGEPFPIPSLRDLKAQIGRRRYVNILGSTETHMIAHYELPDEIPADCNMLPIGKIASRFRNRIVDDELWLAGPGVTPGYWRSPEADAQAFLTDTEGQRWYRTGDLVRAGPEGSLICTGRRDRRIKRRGNRVELAEIEACLHKNPAVKEVAIIVAPDDELGTQMNAWVVPHQGFRPKIVELKAHCAHSLPSYMVPDTFTFCDDLPRTSTGKVDFMRLRGIL
jgi:amino acid adenylation domain-containing protein